ncbi:MAG: 2-hydroxyacid dehydrogenase [Candidatus Thiodiazotropha sp. (ex Lucina aurantia)]|nr:2-hydroxyacid dehydrogenase [Candidatus Thiodiazotropha sp. (ex Lucina pensylvanica)]MBT3056480.1 2-hydroxyacid dehydrogenase [Candidatus Thiodiazotropha sp. (ex Codakia orbicularis)]MBV2104494.1 2-hydroxyacid dehydrogenase [Candidatus Thiodiazotropha sp. (ex Lucina aurantia)]MCG7864510.1 2-hydroxyacid dehydrogenase [Candidatus Thiodiazotropha endolucinida]MBV2101224.1 2-hydroxyacid dehydrogenase [Candidatus Thiodiazotropha sp. (ex Codakia orbicularis)]
MFNKGVFLDVGSVDPGDIVWSPLKAMTRHWGWHRATSPQQTMERIIDAELVISNKVVLDRSHLAACRNLKLICIAATGSNNVDLEAAAEHGIVVTNVTGYATPSVVQHVFSLILSLTTQQQYYQRAVARGDWQRSSHFCLLDYPIRELSGKCMGILGYGELGRGVDRLAKAFGMSVVVAQRPGSEPDPDRIPLDELLPQVDVLTLHVPLAPNTRNLIGARELALMQPHALLINTARGGIVDEAALAEALVNGKLGGAGIDVLVAEPPVDGNPLLNPEIPNLIVTPHIAWASHESRQRLVDDVAANIQAFLAGEIRNRVV